MVRMFELMAAALVVLAMLCGTGYGQNVVQIAPTPASPPYGLPLDYNIQAPSPPPQVVAPSYQNYGGYGGASYGPWFFNGRTGCWQRDEYRCGYQPQYQCSPCQPQQYYQQQPCWQYPSYYYPQYNGRQGCFFGLGVGGW